ncbi:MAG TPA: PaaI family thioesterase [Candidatus Binataceae bacterium]|nr:PaaI family thioesterase [Candidatus Binataceae bacterium]
MDELAKIQNSPLPFSTLLGVKFLSASPERVTAEMLVRKELCTSPDVLHGGAIMALADTLGAYATIVNLKDGQGTTTIESKTNFLSPAPVGTTIKAECSAIHRGRRTMVWQTRVTSAEGRLVAIVTQTQMVLEARA